MTWLPAVTTAPPATEPVTLEEAKLFARVDGAALDVEIARHIRATRSHVEKVTGTRLITQTVRLVASSAADLAALPIGPIRDVTAIEVTTTGGNVVALSGYEVVKAGLFASIRSVFPWGSVRAAPDAIRLTATVGYGAAADVPADIVTAILMLVRAAVAGQVADVDHLLVNDRIWL